VRDRQRAPALAVRAIGGQLVLEQAGERSEVESMQRNAGGS
jgi:hypothetical protein